MNVVSEVWRVDWRGVVGVAVESAYSQQVFLHTKIDSYLQSPQKSPVIETGKYINFTDGT